MNFTYDWISPIIHTLERHLRPLSGQKLRALEIGSFEGRSTVWFMQNIMTHSESEMVCVDHFLGGSDHKELNLEGLRERFDSNTEEFKAKIKVVQADSWAALPQLQPPFDFAFVDGSHESHDVLHDGVGVFRLVKQGGLILFDDYGWGMDRPSRPGIGIDAFLSAFSLKVQVLEKGYSVVVEKL